MLVRQLIGPYAGQIIEMKFTDAQNCLVAGTACAPDDTATPRTVRGLKLVDPDPRTAKLLDEQGVDYVGKVEVAPEPEPQKKPKAKRRRRKSLEA